MKSLGFAARLLSVICVVGTVGALDALARQCGGMGDGSGSGGGTGSGDGTGDGGSGGDAGTGGGGAGTGGGGQNTGPGDIGGPTTGGPGVGDATGPTGGGGSPVTGGAPKIPTGPAGPAAGGPTGGGYGPGGGRGPTTGGGRGGPATPGAGGPVTGKKSRTTISLDRWDLWWVLNRETFLVSRSAAAPLATRQRGFVDGFGVKIEAPVGTRPAPSVVALEIVPALRAALKDGDVRVQRAAAVALGRVVPQELAADAVADLEVALASRDAQVRESALLALGLLGDKSTVRTLWQVMNDTIEARALLETGGGIQSRERAFAALGLGFTHGREAGAEFRRLLSRSAGKDFEVGGCAALALGLLGPAAADQVPFLGEMLCDKGLDRRVRAQVPIALGRIGEAALPLLPYLLQFARDVNEDDMVRESCVLGLARLAAAHDAEIVGDLRSIARDEKDAAIRHYALVALAQIGARGSAAATAEFHAGLARFLAQQLEKGRNKVDQPWTALACGILAGSLATGSPARRDLEDALLSSLRRTNNPVNEGALAIALGLAECRAAGDDLLDRFQKRGDPALRAHFALALGMVGNTAAIEPLRAALGEAGRPELRADAARALDLLGDRSAARELVALLEAGPSAADSRSLACAVARLRDPEVAPHLARLARDRGRDAALRGACCEALGLLAERAELPYTAQLTADLNVHAGLAAPAEVIERL